ncbi:hypothetical protein GN244_ATG17830 [Phytophthora infestans]|uniref:Uncharacterized protein n=1 Tax=Phytophthora infestans TaxID=4787 RepID=A0A833S9N2_PHYIN|nr:hypothetical protein GN244_ATG17830 [Phytophthora infestans]KAF4142689.1 hypothetical protein GN958_ATG08153 [Phytophthora infestans]
MHEIGTTSAGQRDFTRAVQKRVEDGYDMRQAENFRAIATNNTDADLSLSVGRRGAIERWRLSIVVEIANWNIQTYFEYCTFG